MIEVSFKNFQNQLSLKIPISSTSAFAQCAFIRDNRYLFGSKKLGQSAKINMKGWEKKTWHLATY